MSVNSDYATVVPPGGEGGESSTSSAYRVGEFNTSQATHSCQVLLVPQFSYDSWQLFKVLEPQLSPNLVQAKEVMGRIHSLEETEKQLKEIRDWKAKHPIQNFLLTAVKVIIVLAVLAVAFFVYPPVGFALIFVAAYVCNSSAFVPELRLQERQGQEIKDLEKALEKRTSTQNVEQEYIEYFDQLNNLLDKSVTGYQQALGALKDNPLCVKDNPLHVGAVELDLSQALKKTQSAQKELQEFIQQLKPTEVEGES